MLELHRIEPEAPEVEAAKPKAAEPVAAKPESNGRLDEKVGSERAGGHKSSKHPN